MTTDAIGIISDWIIPAFWLAFIVYWAVSAFSVKKNLFIDGSRQNRILAPVIIIIIFLSFYTTPLKDYFFFSIGSPHNLAGIIVSMIGVVLAGAGLAFAVWARRHLGRNWSARPSIKADHELITTGPYRLVRHPIYGGMIVALLGSTLATSGTPWLIWFAVFIIIFISRSRAEESLMMREFPDAYPAYRLRTKSLIPYVI